MNDLILFKKYWDEAVSSTYDRIRSGRIKLKPQINAVWREELLTKRFFSSNGKHAARALMEELYIRRPYAAAKIENMLRCSEMPLGMDAGELAVNAAAAAGGVTAGTIAARSENMNETARAVTGLAGIISTVCAAVNTLLRTSSRRLCRELIKESGRQLDQYGRILGDE